MKFDGAFQVDAVLPVSPPTRGRELKCFLHHPDRRHRQSPPTRGRELKWSNRAVYPMRNRSPPTRGRELKSLGR